jgi:type III secretion protein V
MISNWANLREFVRGGLKYYISHKYAGSQNRLLALRTDSRLEAWTATMATDGGAMSGDIKLSEALRDTVWTLIGEVASATMRPVILTASSALAAIREILAPEFPDVPVVANSELRPDIDVEPIMLPWSPTIGEPLAQRFRRWIRLA